MFSIFPIRRELYYMNVSEERGGPFLFWIVTEKYLDHTTERKIQYTAIWRIVSGIPTFANSIKEIVWPCFSAFWMIITLLAAPRIVKFPAMVLPAASAISWVVVTPPAARIMG